MPSAWRIVSAHYAKEAFKGEGARRFRGRWNSRGVPLVYLAKHRSLAVLEILANGGPKSTDEDYSLIPASWDKSLTEQLRAGELPTNWRAQPPDEATRAVGDEWNREARSAVLAVPNAIIPAETNYLINPAHKDFRRIKIGKAESFIFDPRLLGR